MVGPYLGTAPGAAGLAAPRQRTVRKLGVRRGLGRVFGFSEGAIVYAAGWAGFTPGALRRGAKWKPKRAEKGTGRNQGKAERKTTAERRTLWVLTVPAWGQAGRNARGSRSAPARGQNPGVSGRGILAVSRADTIGPRTSRVRPPAQAQPASAANEGQKAAAGPNGSHRRTSYLGKRPHKAALRGG